MSDPEVTVTIDGQQVPISECNWYQFAPCGCLNAVTVSRDCDNGGWITSEEVAWKEFASRKDVREHEKKLGFIVKIDHKSRVELLMASCPHTPQWGYEKTTLPEGHTWGIPSKSTRLHIYPKPEGAKTPHWIWESTALCGSTHHSVEINPIRDRLECAKCAESARKVQTP